MPLKVLPRLPGAVALAAVACLAVPAARAQEAPPAAQAQVVSPQELALQKRLMAPCCWAGTIDNHESQVASEMKAEIHARLAGGDAPEAILATFVGRYGQRVMAEPPARGLDALVYVLPALALVLGGLLVVAFLRRQTRGAPGHATAGAGAARPLPDDPYERRVEELVARRR